MVAYPGTSTPKKSFWIITITIQRIDAINVKTPTPVAIFNGKVVNADNIKETLKNGLACVNNKEFEIHPDDYEDLVIEKGLLMVDPPYDNTYSDYLPEPWDSERFVKWLTEKSKTNPVCLFGSTKVDDFSDTKNLKPFFDAGWKVLVLSEKAFKGVSPHGSDYDKAQDRSTQKDVMLYNF